MLIEAYNPKWATNFTLIKEVLNEKLSNLVIGIEHIGSTSVPNLAAKPIIDIEIIYNENSHFENIKNALINLGYYHNGNQDVEGRVVFKRTGNHQNEILDNIKHHLYVCKEGCLELQRHLLFRDYLRKNDIASKYYKRLKLEIAEEANNNKTEYASLKELKANSLINYVIELKRIDSKQNSEN